MEKALADKSNRVIKNVVCTYIDTYIHTHTHKHVDTHTHTDTWSALPRLRRRAFKPI